jgi:hypothetical protein
MSSSEGCCHLLWPLPWVGVPCDKPAVAIFKNKRGRRVDVCAEHLEIAKKEKVLTQVEKEEDLYVPKGKV